MHSEVRPKSRVFRAEYSKVGQKVEYSEPSTRRSAEKSSIPSRVLDQKTDASGARAVKACRLRPEYTRSSSGLSFTAYVCTTSRYVANFHILAKKPVEPNPIFSRGKPCCRHRFDGEMIAQMNLFRGQMIDHRKWLAGCRVVRFDPWDTLNNFCFHVLAQKSLLRS